MTYTTTSYHSQKSTLSELVENPVIASLCLGVVVFITCLFGIYSRPLGFLASIWPANAFMLAMLLRLPGSASPIGWLIGLTSFLAADLLNGASLHTAALLNSTNLLGIATAYLMYQRFPKHVVRLSDHTSVFYLICATAAGSCVSGIAGAFINPMGSERLMLGRGTMWAVTEFATYVAFLPVLLAAPSLVRLRKFAWKETFGNIAFYLPLLALIASCCATIFIGGPGGLAFPVPALLWCSLSYPLFLTTILTLIVGLMALSGPDVSLIASPINFEDPLSMISFRLGASLLTLAPVVLAAVMQVQRKLLSQMEYIAHHDALTDIHNRAAFVTKAKIVLKVEEHPTSMLLMDIDNFKSINDNYGHQTGDFVLKTFANRARSLVRPSDFLARIGGEEFVWIMSNSNETAALAEAERFRRLCAEPIILDDGGQINVTVSIGLLVTAPGQNTSLEKMLAHADRLLYRAKGNGRDRVELAVYGKN